jgi:hypothetical protein
VSAVFGRPVSRVVAGLAPVVTLAQRHGLSELVVDRLEVTAEGGANAQLKRPARIAGMVAESDLIEDMDLLRHHGMDRSFTGIQAPSTFGTFPRTEVEERDRSRDTPRPTT